jgi:hypothetical protein
MLTSVKKRYSIPVEAALIYEADMEKYFDFVILIVPTEK